MPSELELRHLHRQVKTALELAIVAFAPPELIDRLSSASGALDAMAELAIDSPPVTALIPRTVAAAESALHAWKSWEKERLPRG